MKRMFWSVIFSFFMIFPVKAINLQKFHFSNSPTFATVEDALLTDGFVTNDYEYILVGSYNYVRAPFIEVDGNQRQTDIIEWMHTFNFGGAYRFNHRLQLGLSSFATYERAIPKDESEDEEIYTLGDSVLDLKYKFYENEKFAISFTPRVYLATGNDEYYTSNEDMGYYFGFAMDKAFSSFQLTLNLGHKENQGAKFDVVDHRRQFHFSVGVLAPLFGKLDLTAEFYRDTPYESDNEQIPSEGNLGIRYNYSNEVALFGGVGVGSVSEENSTDLRSYIGLKFFPTSKNKTEKIKREEKQFGKLARGESLYFATGSAKISNTEQTRLAVFCHHVKADSYVNKIVIEGYASTLGNKERNKTLSLNRSKATKEYLLSCGIEDEKIELVDYGSEFADKVEINRDVDRKVRIRIYRSR